jgi:predicted Holliday junction resolvase-like endonuclease
LLKEFLKWASGFGYVRIGLAVLGLIVLSVVLFQWQCGSSRLEQKLEQKQDQVTEQKAAEEVSETKAAKKEEVSKQADKQAREDVKKAREARNVNTRGTTYEDANSARCRAYPEDSECK